MIKIKLTDVNNNPVNLENEIDYFYLVRNNKYYPVTNISFNNGGISFKLPNLYKGLYKIEIKDKKGSIYPADDNVSILLNQSFESGKETEFINMKDSVLKDVPEIITDYINDDPERFKGKDGKDGRNGIDGKDGLDGKDGVDGKDGRNGIDGKDGRNGIDGKDGRNGIDGKDGLPGKDGNIESVNPNLIPMSADYWVNNSSYDNISGIIFASTGRARLDMKIPVIKGDIYTVSDSTLPIHGFGGLRWYIYNDGVFIESNAIIRGQKRQITMTGNEITFTLYPQTGFETPYEMLLSNDFKQLIKFEKGDINTPVVKAIYNLERYMWDMKKGSE